MDNLDSLSKEELIALVTQQQKSQSAYEDTIEQMRNELKHEQESKINQMKEMMVLEARLNSAENEQIKCEGEKSNLERELAVLR